MCTSKTWSEKLFENWCRENGVNFRCIPREEGRRTPDYELVVNGTTIIAEVKHIDDNSEEKNQPAKNPQENQEMPAFNLDQSQEVLRSRDSRLVRIATLQTPDTK